MYLNIQLEITPKHMHNVKLLTREYACYFAVGLEGPSRVVVLKDTNILAGTHNSIRDGVTTAIVCTTNLGGLKYPTIYIALLITLWKIQYNNVGAIRRSCRHLQKKVRI